MLLFENVPNAIAELQQGQQKLFDLLLNKSETKTEIEIPVNLDGIMPITRLSKATLYGYVQRNEIPYHKKGNRLYFFVSEIVEWVKTGREKTIKEIEAEADAYLINTKIK